MLSLKDKLNANVTHADSASKVDRAITIQGNGSTIASFDGSSAKTVNITKSSVGLGNVDNTADSSKSVKYAASAGSANTVAWGNVSGKPSSYPPSSHTHTKDSVGLGSVDNTADSAKSVKYATNAGSVNGYKFSASTSDLTPGSSALATNEIRFIYE